MKALIATVALTFACTGQVEDRSPKPGGRVPRGWEALGTETDDHGWSRLARDPRSGVVFVLIPAGEFLMGTTREVQSARNDIEHFSLESERPQHRVRLTRPFYLAKTPTTIAQFARFVTATGYVTDAERHEHGVGGFVLSSSPLAMLERASGLVGDWKFDDKATWKNPLPGTLTVVDEEMPVTQVSLDDAEAFCRHYGYRLPTEAEYEFAARGGTTTEYWWGDDPSGAAGNENVADRSFDRRFVGRRGERFELDDEAPALSPVGKCRANPFGLNDMSGDVRSWCSDESSLIYDETSKYYEECNALGTVSDPQGPNDHARLHVQRGASWAAGPFYVRSSCSGCADRSDRTVECGFRCVVGVQ
jgi:formylglycine-generating enzyme required for sulfatase activity